MISKQRQKSIYAAGALCWRVVGGELHVLLVHRPEYDDWSWPKGMAEESEDLHVTAVREVEEETGLRVILGRTLPGTSYMRGPFMKHVSYWAAHVPVGDLPTPPRPREVDETRWMPWEQARQKLTQPGDRIPGDALAQHLNDSTLQTRCVIIAKHGYAYPADAWKEKHDKRPLVKAGGRQAKRLALILGVWNPTELWVGKNVRCQQTVKPYLKNIKAKLHLKQKLALEHSKNNSASLKKIVHKMVFNQAQVFACGTDESISALITSLQELLPPSEFQPIHDSLPTSPGSALVLHLSIGSGELVDLEKLSMAPGK